jgi:hypothetical protein
MKEIVKIEDRIENVIKLIKEMENAFDEIQQPRSEYVLQNFVVGQHDTLETQYSQCVLEMMVKYDNIRRAKLNKKKILLKIKEYEEKNTELDQIEADLLKIDLEEQERAMLGALREFEALYKIWQSFPKKYTREELDDNQPFYWAKRLQRQAYQDMQATGRIGVGNHEALRQAGLASVPENALISNVEKKYLEKGDLKCLLVVATREKAEKLPNIKNLELPVGVQVKITNVHNMAVDAAYNHAVKIALEDGADLILTVEDDTYPPEDGFVKLIKQYKESSEKCILGGWYPRKGIARQGTPIIIKNGFRTDLQPDGQIHEVYTIPMGFTLFPTSLFKEIEKPYFVTTDALTQDSFISQKAREKNWKLLVDTSILCKHLDVSTNIFYE